MTIDTTSNLDTAEFSATHYRVVAFWTSEEPIPVGERHKTLVRYAEDCFVVGVPLKLAVRTALHVAPKLNGLPTEEIIATVGRVYAKNQAC